MPDLSADTITHALNELAWARTALDDPSAMPDEYLEGEYDAFRDPNENERNVLLRRYAIAQIDKAIGQLLPLTY